eukprot:1096878-Pleurochrysis_carterae.AAC.3
MLYPLLGDQRALPPAKLITNQIKPCLPAPIGTHDESVRPCLRGWGRRRGLLGPRGAASVPPILTMWATWPSTGRAGGLATGDADWHGIRPTSCVSPERTSGILQSKKPCCTILRIPRTTLPCNP